MSWILDGQKVKANYLDELVIGTIMDSRVKYGGRVGYTLQLDFPIQLKWRSEPSDRLLIEDKDIIEMLTGE